MEDRHLKALGIAAIFILGIIAFYIQFDSSLEADIEAGNFTGETDGAGYQSFRINYTNQEKEAVKPEFLLLNPSQRGPIKLLSNLNSTIKPGETVSIRLETANTSYIPVVYDEEFMLIIRDVERKQRTHRKVSIKAPVEKTVYQNPTLETFRGQPTGWSELFKGDVRKYSIDKGLKGVELALPEENHQGSFSYYLTQDFNLTENLTIIAEYKNLETAQAGFRILRENRSEASEKSILEVEFTEYTGKSSAILNETFSFRELYREHNQTYNKGQTVQLQLFFESQQGTPNSIHWKKASISNQ